MKILTLIPNAETYGIAILIMLSLGSFVIARHVHIRWLKTKFSLIASNAIVKTVIVMFGLLIIPGKDLFLSTLTRTIIDLVCGVLLGLVCVVLEVYLIRKRNRHKIINKIANKYKTDYSLLRNSVPQSKMSLSTKKEISAQGLSQLRKSYSQYAHEPDFIHYSLIAVILVAIAEEIIFRGYIISAAQWVNGYSSVLIGLSVICFVASHISQSWFEGLAKLPLAIVATAGFIMTADLSLAIAAHVTFNIYAFLQLKNFKYINDAAIRGV